MPELLRIRKQAGSNLSGMREKEAVAEATASFGIEIEIRKEAG